VRVNPVHLPTLRGKLSSISGDPNWGKRSLKARKNRLVAACGLESIYAPVMVLENLIKVKDGYESVCTGRDGRVLWRGRTKLTRYPDVDKKFTSPRYLLGRDTANRLGRLSSLFSDLSESGLPVKAIRPLSRLSLHFLDMKKRDFIATIRAVRACLETKIEVRRPSGINILRNKPYLLGKEIKSKRSCLASVPLWDWKPRSGV